MKIRLILITSILLIVVSVAGALWLRIYEPTTTAVKGDASRISLPAPELDGDLSLEAALLNRRSAREYSDEPITLAQVGQLLWAAQGITDDHGHRTAPSAGALYPLEITLIVGNVDGVPVGFYRYHSAEHALLRIGEGDQRAQLHRAALMQNAVKDAAAVIVISAIYERTEVKYGQRGAQYVHIEAGGAAQNIYLQATALELGTVFIGAFYDDQVNTILGLGENEVPLGLMPVGRK